jgi:FkbM family methyltransferase
MLKFIFRTLPASFFWTVWGFRMVACSWDRALNLLLHKIGIMGAGETNLFGKLIKPGMTVIDIGANQGLYSLLFSRLVSDSGRVFSFEPNPTLFNALQRNIILNSAENIQAFPVALGSTEARMTLYSSLINSGDNRMGSKPFFHEASSVAVERFDKILPQIKADFVKIDVQGWEMNVVEGMSGLFEASPSVSVLMEFWPKGLKQAGTHPKDLLAFFARKGFTIHRLEGKDRFCKINPNDEIPHSADGTYVNLLLTR